MVAQIGDLANECRKFQTYVILRGIRRFYDVDVQTPTHSNCWYFRRFLEKLLGRYGAKLPTDSLRTVFTTLLGCLFHSWYHMVDI